MDQRYEQLKNWLVQVLPQQTGFNRSDWELVPVSGDASFRRYFRVVTGDNSWIAVDAPPDKEDSHPFVRVAQTLLQQGVAVPEVYAQDLQQGFMLLSDLGDALYLGELSDATADELYREALHSLLLIQRCPGLEQGELPPYDVALLKREVELFREWFLSGLLGLSLSVREHARLDEMFACLIDSALAQPKVFVHRDYHSRNLMYRPGQPPGVIDFQDAVWGPVTYDLVSLLRDCYIAWPDEQVYAWVEEYRQQCEQQGIAAADPLTFRRWFDLMGAQRHLKAIGIFARLKLRDDKGGYLADIPRSLGYLLKELSVAEPLVDTVGWLQNTVVPAMYDSGHWQPEALQPWVKL